jgi:hypothetical protein
VNLQHLRWPVILVSMAVVLAALFGGGFLLKTQTVDEPLKLLFSGSAWVERHEIDRDGDMTKITVTVKETPDLATAYVKLHESTHQVMKGRSFQLILSDRRTPALEQAMRRANLFAQEALVTGQFAAMADKIEAEASKVGITARFDVDSEHIYLQLHQDGAFLYQVTERTSPTKAPRAEGGLRL